MYFLFKQLDLEKLIQIIYTINKPLLIVAVLLVLFSYIIGFLRWRMLLGGLGLNSSNWSIFKSYYIGFLSNLFLPSTIGGDLFRTVDLGLRLKKPRQVVASVILDRLSGYCGLVAIALLASFLGFRLVADKNVFIILAVISLLLTSILLVLFNNFLFSKARRFLHLFGRIGEAFSNLHYEIYNFRNQKKIILKNFLYSFFIQIMMPISFYVLSYAAGVRINAIHFYILVPIISVIALLPISMAGLGIREASSKYFFSAVGMSGEIAVAISLLSFSIIVLLALAGGFVYVITLFNRRI